MMTNTKFQAALARGNEMEVKVKNLLESRGWEVLMSLDMETQRKGIDMIATKADTTFAVEVKFDERSSQTGNYYVEIESYQRPGWLHTTQADYLFLANNEVIYVVTPTILRDYYSCRKVGTVRGGDNALGYLLRESALKKLAIQTIYWEGVF